MCVGGDAAPEMRMHCCCCCCCCLRLELLLGPAETGHYHEEPYSKLKLSAPPSRPQQHQPTLRHALLLLLLLLLPSLLHPPRRRWWSWSLCT